MSNLTSDFETTHVLEHYKNHLEFLGYSIETNDEYSLDCIHPRRVYLHLIKLSREVGVLVRTYYNFSKHLAQEPMLLYQYANELNSQFLFMRAWVYATEEDSYCLFIDSVLEGSYDRKNFSIFLDNIEHDIRIFHTYPKTYDMFAEDEQA